MSDLLTPSLLRRPNTDVSTKFRLRLKRWFRHTGVSTKTLVDTSSVERFTTPPDSSLPPGWVLSNVTQCFCSTCPSVSSPIGTGVPPPPGLRDVQTSGRSGRPLPGSRPFVRHIGLEWDLDPTSLDPTAVFTWGKGSGRSHHNFPEPGTEPRVRVRWRDQNIVT